jgi:O-antigen/teichoic acid export membrane protein
MQHRIAAFALLSPTIKTSAALLLRIAAQSLNLLIVARLLGPAYYGVFAGVAALAITLGSLATLGTHVLLLREISTRPSIRQEALNLALGGTAAGGTCLFVAFLAISTAIINTFPEKIALIIAIGVSELLLQPFLLIVAAEFQADGAPAKSQLVMVKPLVVRCLTMIILWWWHPTNLIKWFIVAYALSSIIATSHSLLIHARHWPSPTKWRHPKRTELHESLGFGFLSLTRLGPNELDKTLATQLIPAASAGLYAAGARIIGAAIIPVVALMITSLPILFRHGNSRAGRTISTSLNISTFAYGIICAAALWIAAPLVTYIFGANYAGLDQVLRLLCFAIPALALRTGLGNVMMTAAGPWRRITFEVAGLAILTASAISFHPENPLLRMPVALIASEWSMALLALCMVWRLKSSSNLI